MKQPPLHYRIAPIAPHSHQFAVTLTVPAPQTGGQRFALPAWIPGSYLIRDFARHVLSLRAEHQGQPVAVEKIDKHTWQAAPVTGELVLHYTVYAFDASVRGAYLDKERGFFNGCSVFLAVEGQTDRPCVLEILPPEGKAFRAWQVATSLPAQATKASGFGRYRAQDYDDLIDHPVELGPFTRLHFSACGVAHEFVLAAPCLRLDEERLVRDVQRICTQIIQLFGEPAPFDRYVFMTWVTVDGYGGLEHRASTALMCSRDALPLEGETGVKSAYRQYLGLIAHEYFHAWNVKRIKPAAYAPYDLHRENYSRLLWAFEGITSYYDDLTLVRAGIIDPASYLELLAQTLTSVARTPGQQVQTLEASSFDAWIKLYRPDENSVNCGISYYTKGALVALCLDLHIRRETGQRHSLDDVMRALWQRRGRDFYQGKPEGIAEDEWEAVAEAVTGLPLKPLFDAWLRSTAPLPLQELLASVGVRSQWRPSYGTSDKGGWVDSTKPATGVWLGLRSQNEQGWARISQVLAESPAQASGLSGGDLLVALDGLKISASNLDTLLAPYRPGDTVQVQAFRRDVLKSFTLVLAAQPEDTVGLKRSDDDPARHSAGQAWLGQ